MNTAVDRLHAIPAAPTDTPVQVRVAQAPDEPRLLTTLTLAFASDPPVRWLYPDPDQYLRCFPRFARAFGGGAVALGTACYTAGFAGCALWFPPGTGPDDEALSETMADTIPQHRHGEVFAVLEAMGAVHPTEPHWYLPLIGVDATVQGRGQGSALLREILAVCDRDGLPAYLEATSPRNIALYRRHGFRPLPPLRIEGCPPITPMLRAPAGA